MGSSVPGNSCVNTCTPVITQICPIRLSGECVYYAGPNIGKNGINTGDSIDTAIIKLSATTGTVTSVGLSMPSGFVVTGTPVITSGTLSVQMEGSTAQYLAGDGTLQTLPTPNNGLSASGTNIVLGQSAGASGNPGKLLSPREIPFNGLSISFVDPTVSAATTTFNSPVNWLISGVGGSTILQIADNTFINSSLLLQVSLVSVVGDVSTDGTQAQINISDTSAPASWSFVRQLSNDRYTTSATAGTANPTYMDFFDSGDILINSNGTDADIPSAKFGINSTTQGFLPPRMTTTQRDAITSPEAGLMIYNTSTNKLNVFTTVWEQITSS